MVHLSGVCGVCDVGVICVMLVWCVCVCVGGQCVMLLGDTVLCGVCGVYVMCLLCVHGVFVNYVS